MTSPLKRRLRKARDRWEEFIERQYVNFSVEIHVVDRRHVLDPTLDPLHREHYGGLYDPEALLWSDEAPYPAKIWQVSESQYDLIKALERALVGGGASRYVFVGGMGSGKTEGQARMAAFLSFFITNGNVGMVAPVRPRLGILRDKFCSILHPSWVLERRDHTVDEPPYVRLVSNVRYQFVAAKAGSGTTGNPIQGHDWQAGIMDEEQDIASEAVSHVALRGRAAVDGCYPMISTCTIKDTVEFRDRLAQYEADPGIVLRSVSLLENPWIAPRYIEELRSKMSPRRWAQLVEGKPQPPERATYQFTRAVHVKPRPLIGAVDVTRHVCNADMLIGHDPGELCDVSIMLKCYEMRLAASDGLPARVVRNWWVVDEWTTERTTTEQHVARLREHLQSQWRMQMIHVTRDGIEYLNDSEPFVHVRTDPHDAGEGKPFGTVVKYFRLAHFDIRPAVYRNSKNPSEAGKPGVVRRESRIEVVNTLLMNAQGETRLYLDCNERGYPKAPQLATALEMSERDEFGRAEFQRKGEHDLSHWPSALGFALYPYERARVGQPVASAGAYR